jgi:streptomycin 6-kinase
LTLPAALRERIIAVFGERGETFSAQFSVMLRDVAARWQLEIEPPFPDLSYNFVAPAWRGNDPVVVKLGVPNPELSSEIEALQLLAGEGAVRLLDADADRGILLLERLVPGTRLAREEDDDRAIAIGAETMARLWRRPPAEHAFRSVDDWTQALSQHPDRYPRDASPIPATWVERAIGLLSALRATAGEPTFLHADLHQFNILRTETRGFLAIDPKGAVGDAGFEVGPLIQNLLLDCTDPRARLQKRIRRVALETGLDEDRVLCWAFVQTVLSTCWSVEDRLPWRAGVARTQLIGELLP